MKEEYRGREDLILELPDEYDIYNISWISVYCYKYRVVFGSVSVGNISARIPPHVPPQKRVQIRSIECKLQSNVMLRAI